ncbi:MAG TPA: hypothetical protein VFO00_04355, partial [Vitreimonas sp.]|nr:hypothetical protein [Vitreimonas sp.]
MDDASTLTLRGFQADLRPLTQIHPKRGQATSKLRKKVATGGAAKRAMDVLIALALLAALA